LKVQSTRSVEPAGITLPPSPAQAVDESVRVWFPSSIIIIEYGWNCELAVPKFVMEKAHEVVLGPTTEHMADETVTSGFCVFDPRRPKKYEPTGTVDTIATTRRKISATAARLLSFSISLGARSAGARSAGARSAGARYVDSSQNCREPAQELRIPAGRSVATGEQQAVSPGPRTHASSPGDISSRSQGDKS
jgi:hypothetical protein